MQRNILVGGMISISTGLREGYIVLNPDSGLITDVRWGRDALRKCGGENSRQPSGEISGKAEAIDSPGLETYIYDDSYVIEAGDFNAHSHPEQSLYTDIVDKSWDLPTWCRNTIYKYSPVLRPEHIYLGCCRAFARMLQLGVTSVMVSFYCHMRQGNVYDREVIRAARDTGIRLIFGRMNYDIINQDAYEAKRNSQHCYFETPAEAEENFRELMQEVESAGHAVCAPSIHSIHASTKDAIVRAINLGNEWSLPVQFHLSEDQGDVALALQWYGLRPVEFLVDLLNTGEVASLSNLVLSDCVWIDERERELLREHGMKVVLNPRMNAQIKAGEADLPALVEKGIEPYLGTDGEASNDDLSIRGEREFLQQRFPTLAQSVIAKLGRQPFRFKAGFIGDIAPGHYGDLRVTRQGVVQDVFVGGKKVLQAGTLTGLDVEREIEQPLKDAVLRIATG